MQQTVSQPVGRAESVVVNVHYVQARFIPLGAADSTGTALAVGEVDAQSSH